MVFNPYVNKSRVSGTLNFNTFLHQLIKIKNLKKGAAFNNKQKHDMFHPSFLDRYSCSQGKVKGLTF